MKRPSRAMRTYVPLVFDRLESRVVLSPPGVDAPVVSVSATTDELDQSRPDQIAYFSVERTGDVSSNLTVSLHVGNEQDAATPGMEYVSFAGMSYPVGNDFGSIYSGSLVIPAGFSKISVPVKPIKPASPPATTQFKSLTLVVDASANYSQGGGPARVNIKGPTGQAGNGQNISVFVYSRNPTTGLESYVSSVTTSSITQSQYNYVVMRGWSDVLPVDIDIYYTWKYIHPVTFQSTEIENYFTLWAHQDRAFLDEYVTTPGRPAGTYIASLTEKPAYKVVISPATVTVKAPDPTVSISTLVAGVLETSSSHASFRIKRTGDLSASMTVSLTYAGSAEAGDYSGGPPSGGYQPPPTSVTIPAGQDHVDSPLIYPIEDSDYDNETVEATISVVPSGVVLGQKTATVTITDTTANASFTVTPLGSGRSGDSGSTGEVPSSVLDGPFSAGLANGGLTYNPNGVDPSFSTWSAPVSLPPNAMGVGEYNAMGIGRSSSPLPIYMSDGNAQPIVSADVTLPSGTPQQLKATLTVTTSTGTVTVGPIYYDVSNLALKAKVRVALLFDGRAYPTGRYSYNLKIDAQTSAGSFSITSPGKLDLISTLDSAAGENWNLDGTDRIVFYGSTNVGWLRSDNTVSWFTTNGSGFTTPLGTFAQMVRTYNGATPSGYSITTRERETLVFDLQGRLLTRKDRNANTWTYNYNTDGTLASIVDPYSRSSLYGYTSGYLTSITDVSGRVTTFGYSTSFINPARKVLTSITLPSAGSGAAPRTTLYTYDSATGQLKTVTDPEGRTTTISYDFAGRLDRVSRPGGTNTSTITTDWYLTPSEEAGLATPGTGGSPSNPIPVVLSDDVEGHRAAYALYVGETVPRNLSAFATKLDPVYGYVLRERSGASLLSKVFIRNDYGQVVEMKERDADGNVIRTTTYEYATETGYRGEIKKRTLPDGTIENWTYSSTTGRPLTRTVVYPGGASRVTSMSYDTLGNLLSIVDPLIRTTTYQSDSRGRLVMITTPPVQGVSATTSIGYDSAGYINTTTANGVRTTTFGYDATTHDLTSMTDPDGRTTNYSYDSAGRLLEVILPSPDAASLLPRPTTTYAYNAADQVVSVTSPAPDASTPRPVVDYTYDAQGRPMVVTGPVPMSGEARPATTYSYDGTGRLAAVVAPNGHRTGYGYDSDGRLVSTIEGPTGYELVHWFDIDALGRVRSVKDPLGWFTIYTYDLLDRVKTVVDPRGQTAAYDYTTTTDDQRTVIADAYNQLTTYIYDKGARLTSIVSPGVLVDQAQTLVNPTVTYSYDALDRLSWYRDERGFQTDYTYDIRGRLLQVQEPDPSTGAPTHRSTTSYSYNDSARTTTVADDLGRQTVYGYDRLNRLTSVVLPSVPVGPGSTVFVTPTENYEYDGLGRLIAVESPKHNDDVYLNRVVYAYDGLNRLRSETLPIANAGAAAAVTTYDYDASGNLRHIVAPMGRTTELHYDAYDRLDAQTDAAGYVTNYEYDGNRNLLSVEDGTSGITTKYTYDAVNRVHRSETLSTDGGSNASTEYSYDLVDNLILEESSLARKVKYDYDALGRMTARTSLNPNGSLELQHSPRTDFQYDRAGNLIKVIDPMRFVTTYSYDGLGRMTDVYAPIDGSSTAHTATMYDTLGQVHTVTDPAGNTTTYDYDALGRLKTETNALGKARTYEYNAAGDLTATIDRNGRRVAFLHDRLGRTLTETWVAAAPNTPPTRTITYAYDLAGRLSSASDPSSYSSFGYDALDRVSVASAQVLDAGVRASATLNYQYNSLGQITSLAASFLGGASTTRTYGYDRFARPDHITSDFTFAQMSGGLSLNVAFAYDSGNRLSSITRTAPSGVSGAATVKTEFDYDFLNRLYHQKTTTQSSSGSTMPLEIYYSIDINNRITAYAAKFYAGSSFAEQRDYSYDQSGQLTKVSGYGDNLPNLTSFTYDAAGAGNRTAVSTATTSSPTPTTKASSTGTDNRLTDDGVFTYTYDDEGNRLTRTRKSDNQLTTYTWDYRNRLVDVLIATAAGAQVEHVTFAYDAFDRRVAKTTAGSNPSSRYTVYDGENPLADFDASGTATAVHLHAEAVDALLASVTPSGGVSWYLTDNQGSVREVLNAAGSVVDRITYDAFGGVAHETNASAGGRFKYTSREWDGEIGLQYNRARYYDPSTGRWISQDPIGFAGGDANLYRYVGNSPTNATDPSGLIHQKTTGSPVSGSSSPGSMENLGSRIKAKGKSTGMPADGASGPGLAMTTPWDGATSTLLQAFIERYGVSSREVAQLMYALSQDYSIEAAGVGSFWMPLWERSSISELGDGGRVISISQRVRYLPGLFGYDQTLGEASDALRSALADRFRDSSDTVVGGLVSALGSLNLSAAQFRHVADHPDIYGPEIVAVMGQASEENQQYIGYLANTMRYYGRNAGRDYAYGKLASAGLAWGVGRVGAPNSGLSAKGVHDKFVNQVRPGARERVFDTPWSKNKGLGSRKFDDFDDVSKTGFEGNTTPWSQMTQEQLSRKLDQVGSDFALLQQKSGPVKRVIWFGTEPLPTTGLGGQLREALEKAGIKYWVVKS